MIYFLHYYLYQKYLRKWSLLIHGLLFWHMSKAASYSIGLPVLAAPLLNQLSSNFLRKASRNGASVWILLPTLKKREKLLAPGFGFGSCGHLGSHPDGTLLFVLSVSSCVKASLFCNSGFQITT